MSKNSGDNISELKHVRLADASSGRSRTVQEIIYLQWNALGTRIAVSKTDKSLRIWKIGERTTPPPLVIENAHEKSVEGISWNPLVDNVLSTVALDRYVKTWNVVRGDLLKQIDTGVEKLYILEYSPDGKFIAAVSKSINVVVILDASNGDVVHKIETTAPVYSITWNNTSRFLFIGLGSGSIQVYDFKDDEYTLLTTLRGHRSSIKSLRFDPRARYLIAGGNEGVVSIWSLEDFSLVKTIAEVDEPIYTVDSSFDGSYVGVTFEDNEALKIYNITDKKEILTVSRCVSGRQTFPVFKFAPVKPYFAYSTATGELYHTLPASVETTVTPAVRTNTRRPVNR